MVRINTDATISPNNMASLGAVAHDKPGKIVDVAMQRCHSVGKVTLAEVMATSLGLVTAKRLGFMRVELQCDALNVVQASCLQQHGKAPVDLVFDDIRSLGMEFDSFVCSHIKRVGNCVAHLAARSCHLSDGL